MNRRHYSINYLVGSIPKPKAPVAVRSAPKRPRPSAPPLGRLIYTPHDLLQYFHNNIYSQPSKAQLTQADTLFYNSKINHEWTCIEYDQIPDIKYEHLRQKRQYQLSKSESSFNTDHGSNHNTDHDIESSQHSGGLHNSAQNFNVSKKSFGIEPSLLKPLPEVLFLGHTNAGKSTLINSLLLSKHEAKTPNLGMEYAYVSKREGYTKCLNCYNVGNKLRLVDSPGYGRFGEESQGKVVLDYIQKRSQLRRTFLIIDSMQGLRDEDASLVDHLTESGAPFEVIFTKIDEMTMKIHQKVVKSMGKNAPAMEVAQDINSKLIEHFQGLIEDSGLGTLASLPRIWFNNSHSNQIMARRYGFHEIRYAIAESCGLVGSGEVLPEFEALPKSKGQKVTRSLQINRVT